MAKREREFNELQAKRQAEKRAREEQKNQAIPVLYSNAQIFKGMKASVNITNSQRHVCKRLIHNSGMGNVVAYLKMHFTE
eukprot:CAMPEP_0185615898 /NCGR_PEP_ID=MMETSP0436-20130131/37612_1 /TAXON_ID=626734 ORGANISM="Favella taraikaensis, Strain Fe Narragansett Bay" /NCGR_SAMPLE_ID=MMETSP0436 /ASSEMBLY_ACC=CAM_ASM_000390 /LENGTH=79 /DNA_ID=CAMNT_0028252113 /DNA_START=122 /DNA_END=361 /DNA_ORIENTATION=-